MPRYYFDTRDNKNFLADDVGIEFESFDALKAEAARAMAQLAEEVLPGSEVRNLAIEVRDDIGPVLIVKLRFEIEHVIVR
jgi:hypothetical protein